MDGPAHLVRCDVKYLPAPQRMHFPEQVGWAERILTFPFKPRRKRGMGCSKTIPRTHKMLGIFIALEKSWINSATAKRKRY
jgi:hypothetical protein